jgi:uncharacterized metal-binding protein
MPGARTHDIITLVTAAGGAAAYGLYAPQPDLVHAAIFTGTYLFAGFACAGDLDIDSAQYRRWGPLRFIWFPYQKIVPHRSWVSHGMIAGGLIRALYLALVFFCLSATWLLIYGQLQGTEAAQQAAKTQIEAVKAFLADYPTHIGVGLAGFILAGAVHTVTDAVSTWFKRRF